MRLLELETAPDVYWRGVSSEMSWAADWRVHPVGLPVTRLRHVAATYAGSAGVVLKLRVCGPWFHRTWWSSDWLNMQRELADALRRCKRTPCVGVRIPLELEGTWGNHVVRRSAVRILGVEAP